MWNRYTKLADEIDELFNREKPPIKSDAGDVSKVNILKDRGGIDFSFQFDLKIKGNPLFTVNKTYIMAGKESWSVKASHSARMPPHSAQEPYALGAQCALHGCRTGTSCVSRLTKLTSSISTSTWKRTRRKASTR